MNNTYATSSLPPQLTHSNAQHVAPTSIAYLPAHVRMDPPTTQQQQQQQAPPQQQQQRQLNTISEDMQPLGRHVAVPTSSSYFDVRNLEKTYANYAGTAAGRYFTASGALPALHQPHNTILITNNFTQQNMPNGVATVAPPAHTALAAPNFSNNNNIRIISTAPSVNTQSHNLYNLNSVNKESTNEGTALHLPHLQQHATHLFQHHQAQLQQQQSTITPFPTHLSNLQFQQHFANLAAQQQLSQAHQQHTPLTMHFGNIPTTTSQYFVHPEPVSNADTSKLLPALVPTTTSLVTSATTTLPTRSVSNANNSTVVLDRINICINNHYADSANNVANSNDAALSALTCTTATTTTTADNEQQPSPVIPAIQHKAQLLDCNLDSSRPVLNDVFSINNEARVHVIDEPDSTTTTPHTPPTTPNNTIREEKNLTNSPLQQSPSTTTMTNDITVVAENLKKDVKGRQTSTPTTIIAKKNKTDKEYTVETTTNITTIILDNEENKDDDVVVDVDADDDEVDDHDDEIVHVDDDDDDDDIIVNDTVDLSVKDNEKEEIIEEHQDLTSTIHTPTSPNAKKSFASVNYEIGEDVLLKRHDNRFYLGTVIDNAHQQYLVRFDDKSEQWCTENEMRKLGGGTCVNENDKDSASNSMKGDVQTKMCVACKRRQPADIVESCERCGRGYHRGCTMEVSPGSGEWLCKR